MPTTTEFHELEAALLGEASVLDCVVRRRSLEDQSAAEIVAYIVPLGEFSEEGVRSVLSEKFSQLQMPDRYVLLSSIPLLEDGTVDEEALARFEVVDESLAKLWEQKLLSLPNVQEASVVIEHHAPRLARLHVADLLGVAAAPKPTESKPPVSRAEKGDGSPHRNKKAAISHGEPLSDPDCVPPTLPAALARAAAMKPTRAITYVQADGSEVIRSYQELIEDAEHILGGLRALGLRAGDKVIFQLEENKDFIPAFWGCVLGGFIPAPISIAPTYTELNSTLKKLRYSWEMLEHPVVLTGQRLADGVRHASKLLGSEGMRVETVEKLRTAGRDHNWHSCQPEEACLILLTSGSTGSPKGVLQSHRSLLYRSAGTAQVTRLDATDMLLNWFPLDHVGGIVMSHLMALYIGAGQIHAPINMILEQPLKWLDLIEQHRATATWAPNFAFGLINEHESALQTRRWDLSSIRFILNGGEAIVPKTARKFLELLARHGLRTDVMHPSWGMSETCSGVAFSDRCLLDVVRDEDSFVEVGAPIPGISFRIVDGTDQILEEGQIGRLQVKGLPVTTGYYRNAELNQESFSSDGWFNTGDLAVLNEGRLTITGRSKDVIIINGANFFSHEIEAVVEEVPAVEASYAAAFAVRSPSDNTDRLCVVFHPLTKDAAERLALIRRIREALVTKAGVKPAFVIPLERADIPKTAIGKIERSTLRRRFEAGDYDAVVKSIEVDTESNLSVPNWFFRKTWTAQQPRIFDWERLRGRYLVFSDDGGLASKLRREIGVRALSWVEVARGEEFARIDDSHYSLNPGEPTHYQLLSSAIAQNQNKPDFVLHLWTYSQEHRESRGIREIAQAQQAGTYSVLRLAQLLDAAHPTHPIRFFVVSSHAQAASEQDRLDCEKTTLLGLLKTIALEMPSFDCRHIDLEARSPEEDARRLCRELAISKSRTDIAYRGDQRLQAALSQVDMLAQPLQPLPISRGGLYLITGGLGGIGTCLSEFLSRQYGCKLILVGRTALPSKEDAADAAESNSVLARRIRNYRRIEASGADFLYRSADICDVPRLRAIVQEAEAHWSAPLAGIFHLAGEGNLERHWKVMDQHWVRAESTDTFEWMFGPKVYGTYSLFELIDRRPEVVFIAFSSVFSLFGSATSSGYSAASSFLDAYCDFRRKTTHPHTYCFNWTVWDELGMSEAGPAAVGQAFQNMGYSLMSSNQALDSMAAALLRQQHQLAIGLDLASPHVQRHALIASSPLRRLNAYYVLRDGDQPLQPAGIEVHDRFGVRTYCQFANVASAGLTDVRRAGMNGNERPARKRIEPSSETERRIARIWREVLGLPSVSADDKFFELGGDSLLALRVVNRLRESFGIHVSLRDLFEMPTISEFAAVVTERRGHSSGLGSPAMANEEPSSDEALLEMMDKLPDAEIDALLKRVSQA